MVIIYCRKKFEYYKQKLFLAQNLIPSLSLSQLSLRGWYFSFNHNSLELCTNLSFSFLFVLVYFTALSLRWLLFVHRPQSTITTLSLCALNWLLLYLCCYCCPVSAVATSSFLHYCSLILVFNFSIWVNCECVSFCLF